METCQKAFYQSVDWCTGQTKLPGIKPKVFFIPKADIVQWPTLPEVSETTASLGELATLTGDFVLAADAKWKFLKCIADKSPVSTENQGEVPCKSFLNKATIFLPSTAEDATGFCRMANNDDLVFLVQQKNGKFRLIGNDMIETNVAPAQNLGENATGESGTTLEISVTDICPSPFYTGKIETEDGDISGADGKPITPDAEP